LLSAIEETLVELEIERQPVMMSERSLRYLQC